MTLSDRVKQEAEVHKAYHDGFTDGFKKAEEIYLEKERMQKEKRRLDNLNEFIFEFFNLDEEE